VSHRRVSSDGLRPGSESEGFLVDAVAEKSSRLYLDRGAVGGLHRATVLAGKVL
jgi:hypothetical protein